MLSRTEEYSVNGSKKITLHSCECIEHQSEIKSELICWALLVVKGYGWFTWFQKYKGVQFDIGLCLTEMK